MLDEFVNDLKKTLALRRDRAQHHLNEGGAHDERHRGERLAYATAIEDVDELMSTYREPESVPEHIQRTERSGRGRSFGSRRVA